MKRILLMLSLLFVACDETTNPTDHNHSIFEEVTVLNLLKDNGMVLIPATDSTFTFSDSTIGSITVTLKNDFYIDSIETTQKRYTTIMDSIYEWYRDPLDWSKYNSGNAIPAYGVTWYQAVLFCNARSKFDGYDTAYSYDSISWEICADTCMRIKGLKTSFESDGYRLPTEAEWIYACQATSVEEYFWGNDTSLAKEYCWYQINSGNEVKETGKKYPNQFGLYDILGNLDEYCNDIYSPFDSSILTDPTGPETGSFIVKHGGAFYQPIGYQNIAKRQKTNPESFTNYTGFRTVRRTKK